MRELKFRAFNKKEKKMCKVVSTDFKLIVTIRFPEFDGLIGDFDDQMELNEFEPLMQYTGLKDNNGVEIYEGDIVTAKFWDDEQKIYSETAIVDFEEGSFILKLSNDEWSYFNGTQSVEVIGNIHEHPHLLEVSTE